MDSIKLAEQYGTDAGKAAASWVFDGNTSEATYRRFLQVSEDGDPAIDEFAPASGWLSGEWADTTLPQDIAEMCQLERDEDGEVNEYEWDACMDAYETAADEAYWAELERIARYQTAD